MAHTRIIRRPEVEARTGLKRSQIYALAKQGCFPKPIKITSRSSGWVETEIEVWVQDRIRKSRSLAT